MYKPDFLNTYQSSANETAVYPGRFGERTECALVGLFYVSLGLSGEIGELQEKIIGNADKDAITKELGDVYWYISQVCMELNLPMGYLTKIKVEYKNLRKISDFSVERYLLALSILSGRICEILKKTLRDNNGHLQPQKKEDMIKILAKILYNMLGVCGVCDCDPQEVMNINIEKLFSRKERGVLQGSGDNR